ncbi:hypothetical protein F4821DRAFT_237272 [Hypoxylon rubiginosum]|uniref:Uncharacterized protein n=1 Tax=Hypoxylon rubiginosum TaxID=110542 RepID=A0ACC0D2J4_9PEZI|nr:hypothetical protein F4821DRAFT_237272 [Hypoxylon rubiginosum]
MSTGNEVSAMVSLPTFSPAPSCTQDIYYVIVQDISCVDSGGSEVACRYFHLGPTTSTSDCFPTAWTPTPGAYISPGTCPDGYTVACAQSDMGEPENTGTCCPSGFSCQTDSTGFPWYTTDLCVQHMADTLTYVYTTRTPGEDFETTTITGGGGLNAFGVAIRWQASDLIASTTPMTSTSLPVTTLASTLSFSPSPGSTPTSTPAYTPTSSPASTVPSSPTSTPLAIETNASSDPGDLSIGTRVGIGVGAGIAFIVIFIGSYLLWRTWRKKRSRSASPSDGLPGGKSMLAVAMSGLSISTTSTRLESALVWPYQTEWYELPERREPAELWSGSRWR